MRKLLTFVILAIAFTVSANAQTPVYEDWGYKIIENSRFELGLGSSLHIRNNQCTQLDIGTPASSYFVVRNSYGYVGSGQYENCPPGGFFHWGMPLYMGTGGTNDPKGEIWAHALGGIHLHKFVESHYFRFKPNEHSEIECNETNRFSMRMVKDVSNQNDLLQVCMYKDGVLAWY